MSRLTDPSPFLRRVCHVRAHSEAVKSLAWAPGGKWLATGDCSGGFKVWPAHSLCDDSRPRHARNTRAAVTGLEWSRDGKYIACASDSGNLEVLDSSQLFEPVANSTVPAAASIRCLSWMPNETASGPRIALGGDDRLAHFRNFEDWQRPDREIGIGHQSPISSIAWGPDGSTVVTGTEHGTIGIWKPFGDAVAKTSHKRPANTPPSVQRIPEWGSYYGLNGRIDYGSTIYPLTNVLSRSGIFAHDGPVSGLAWAQSSGMLASAGLDGRIQIWGVEDGMCLAALALEDAVLHIKFAFADEFLVIQTSERILFARARPLEIIWQCTHAASYDHLKPLSTCGFDVDSLSRLALPDNTDANAIAVWKVDFPLLLKISTQSPRPYRAIAIPIHGAAQSGKTSLAKSLIGLPFPGDAEPAERQCYCIAMPHDIEGEIDAEEIREIALWDIPEEADHPLSRLWATESAFIAVLALCPEPGSKLNASINLDKWRQAIQRWTSPQCHQYGHVFGVITQCDRLGWTPSGDDINRMAQSLGLARVFIASSASGKGIQDLRHAIFSQISWNSAAEFVSAQAIHELAECIESFRSQARALVSMRELKTEFLRTSVLMNEIMKSDDQFRSGLRILQLKGEIHYIDNTDEVILEQRLYRNYASALMYGARQDAAGMGRLPLDQAESGIGPQIHIAPDARLADMRDHRKMLALAIEEMHALRIAQRISTDGVSYLVFPGTLSRIRDGAENRHPPMVKFQIDGCAEEMFSALIVKLLGLDSIYPSAELWKHEAVFHIAAGGSCNILFNSPKSIEEATISLAFDPETNSLEINQFVRTVRKHLGTGIIELPTPAAPVVIESTPGSSRDSIEVFISWRQDSDLRTAETTAWIANKLHESKIQTFGDSQVRIGKTEQEYSDRIRRAKVALVLLARRPTKEHLDECRLLAASGARIIPVVLPNAIRTFSMPSDFKNWEQLDLRGKVLDIDALKAGITEAWNNGPLKLQKAHRHVFLSYFRQDLAKVSQLVADLNRSGHDVWWDMDDSRLHPGAHWDHELKTAIRESYAYVFCFAGVERTRSYVFEELKVALDVQRTLSRERVFIIPVRLAKCDVEQFFDGSVDADIKLQHFDYFGRNRNISRLAAVLDRARDIAESD